MPLFVIEGPDGVGKSTQVDKVANALRLNGHPNVLVYQAPGTTLVGKSIRSMVKEHEYRPNDQMVLMAAAIIDANRSIQAELSKKTPTIVICDRWTLSTYVYQVMCRGASAPMYNEMLAAVSQVPEAVFVLNAPERTQERREARGTTDVIEEMIDPVKVAEGYEEMTRGYISHNCGKTIEVDADRSVFQITQDLLERIEEILDNK